MTRVNQPAHQQSLIRVFSIHTVWAESSMGTHARRYIFLAMLWLLHVASACAKPSHGLLTCHIFPKIWTNPVEYYHIYPKYWDRQAWANSVDLDQIFSFTAAHHTWAISVEKVSSSCRIRAFQSGHVFCRPLIPYLPKVLGWLDLSKLCRPRSDAAECGVWSAFTLFATQPTVFFFRYINK